MSTLDILKFHSKCVKLSRNYLSANTTTNNFIRITLNQTGQMLGLSENWTGPVFKKHYSDPDDTKIPFTNQICVCQKISTKYLAIPSEKLLESRILTKNVESLQMLKSNLK